MKKILILDDNEDILGLIMMILDMEGYNSMGISTGKELMKTVQEFDPDLVLLDVLLGDYDGRALCNELKSNASTAHIPVVMISASHAALSFPPEYHQPDDFISKPFDIDDLVNRVSSLVQ